MQFYKYQGTGNDFILIDNRESQVNLSQQEIENLCTRRFGIGADGLILLENGAERLRMVYYNSDGRESTMCGNGGRCFARFAQDLGLSKNNAVEFDAIDGWHKAEFIDEEVLLQMKDCEGIQNYQADYVLDTGSPHYIKFAEASFWTDKTFVESARGIRNSANFKEKGINVNYIHEEKPGLLRIRTFERGVEDETYSCGTGVTAAALVYGSKNQLQQVHIESKGGMLSVSFVPKDGQFFQVFLKGPAVKVFEGALPIC